MRGSDTCVCRWLRRSWARLIDVGQIERLITEIPVTADSLFGSQLTSVIVDEAKRVKNWTKFCKAAEHCGLQKILPSPADQRVGLFVPLKAEEPDGPAE